MRLRDTCLLALAATVVVAGRAPFAQAGPPSVTLLGISGHGAADEVVAKVASASLAAALNQRFSLISGEKYQHTAAVLDAPSPAPGDVVKVCAALGLGYLVAGLVEEQDGERGITVTVRRGADGMVAGRFHYTLLGPDLDEDTALLMDGQVLDGITADASSLAGSVAGVPATRPTVVASAGPDSLPAVAPAASLPAVPVVAAAGGPGSQPLALSPLPPSSGPVIQWSASGGRTEIGEAEPASEPVEAVAPPPPPPPPPPVVKPEDENPLGVTSAAGEPLVGEAGGTEIRIETAPRSLALGGYYADAPLAVGNLGVTFLKRTFTSSGQTFRGPAAPAAHVDLTVYPLQLVASMAGESLANSLGLSGSLDYGTSYQVPVLLAGVKSTLQASQSRYELGLRYSSSFTALGRAVGIYAGLGLGGRTFTIQQSAALEIPSISLLGLQVSLGASVPLISILKGFARVAVILPFSVSVDTAKYGEANSSGGLDGEVGVAVMPRPWLSIAASFEVISEGFFTTMQGSANESYLGGTASVGVLY